MDRDAQSFERFPKSQNADSEQHGRNDRHGEEFRPQDSEPDTLEEGAADDHEIIPQGIGVGEPLQRVGHAGDRETKSRQCEERIHDEVRRERLLLGRTDRGDQQSEGEQT